MLNGAIWLSYETENAIPHVLKGWKNGVYVVGFWEMVSLIFYFIIVILQLKSIL